MYGVVITAILTCTCQNVWARIIKF